jgi:hypothetical protein
MNFLSPIILNPASNGLHFRIDDLQNVAECGGVE